MNANNVVTKLSKIGKFGIVPATVISTSPKALVVRLSQGGSVITITTISGPMPQVGSTINVDMSSGNPVALTSEVVSPVGRTVETRTTSHIEESAGKSHDHLEMYLVHVSVSQSTH
jgi:hypothetical protein